MAQLDIASLLYPAAVGAISAGAELFSQHHVAHPPTGGVNDLIANAGMAVDVILPVAAVLNHVTDAVFSGEASSSLMGAAVAIGVRRGTTFIGHKVLKLNVTPSPGAYAHRHNGNQVARPRARREMLAYDPGRVEVVTPRRVDVVSPSAPSRGPIQSLTYSYT